MKRTWLAFVLFTLCVLPMLVAALSSAAKATPDPASLDVNVEHVVEIRNSGLLIINDTVTLSTKPGESAEPLQNYVLGFPYAYQSNLDYAFAYEASNPNATLKLELDTGMGRIGFYGTNVIFPQAVDVSNGGSYEFTVIFVFSNSVSFRVFPLEEQEEILYNATFPAYPSLTQSSSVTKLTIIFGTDLRYALSSFENEGINFTRTVTGSKQYFSYVKGNLSEFSDQIGWFGVSKVDGVTEQLDVKEVEREIKFLDSEQIAVYDSYRVASKASSLAKVYIILPKEAFDILAFDDLGSISTDRLNIEQGNTRTNVTITFTAPFEAGDEARFAVGYQLPWKNYVSTESWSDFHVSLTLFENSDWTIRKLTTTIVLPEGATLHYSPLSAGLNSVQNSAFGSSLTFAFENVTPFNNLSFSFSYTRVVFWESFHPTLWMGALVIVIGAVVGTWRVYRPQAAAPLPTAIIPIRVEELRSFVDSYDDRRRYQQELESLEARARKGKIPRRRYRVRRRTIESRVASYSRDLSRLRKKIRTAGPRYADLMRQLEVAETELQGVEADLSRTEVRYRRGEISAAAYHKLLEDSYRRRDRAKTTIDGVLLRLREEIS